MDFTSVTAAIADVEAAEKQFENLTSADAAAQSASVNAQKTAADTSAAKVTGKTALVTSIEALKKAVSDFETLLG